MERINSPSLLNYAPQPQSSSLERKAPGSYSMVRSERTAGYIPSYNTLVDKSANETKALSQDEAFAKIVQDHIGPPNDTYTLTLDEQRIEGGTTHEGKNRFDIFDFLDMINPLQHIPVVNYAYRYLTGDSIKPISSIIGGAVFAGPVGAASGLVTAVVEHEVGSTLPETVLSITSKGMQAERIAAYGKPDAYAQLVNDSNYDFNT